MAEIWVAEPGGEATEKKEKKTAILEKMAMKRDQLALNLEKQN